MAIAGRSITLFCLSTDNEKEGLVCRKMYVFDKGEWRVLKKEEIGELEYVFTKAILKAFKQWQMEWCSGHLSSNDALRLEEELRHHKTNTSMLESITHKHEMGM